MDEPQYEPQYEPQSPVDVTPVDVTPVDVTPVDVTPVDVTPVAVALGIRKRLAEFQRTSSRQELLAALRLVCRAALPCWVPGSFHADPAADPAAVAQAVAQAVAYLERHEFYPTGAIQF
jgi:hypothetical protein